MAGDLGGGSGGFSHGGDAAAAAYYDDRGLSLEQIQREYVRQRAAVVEELRRAKEEAEAERKRILARINRTLAGGWH